MAERAYEVSSFNMGESFKMIEEKKLPEITIYTDGACLGNPGPGGWAAIIKGEKEYKEIWGGEKNTTNNRMELTAIIEALKTLKSSHNVKLITDSKYIYNAITQKWLERWQKNNWISSSKKKVKNRDLWEKISELFKKHNITIEWIPAHKGIKENERCDRLAKKAARQYKES